MIVVNQKRKVILPSYPLELLLLASWR